MVVPRPFSDQNTGLTNQAGYHLASCGGQFLAKVSAVFLLAYNQNSESIFQMSDHWLAIMS